MATHHSAREFSLASHEIRGGFLLSQGWEDWNASSERAFQYETVAKDRTDFQEWLVDPDKIADLFLGPLVDGLEASGRVLQGDQCYSFIKPLALGGSLSLDNVMTIPVREHFTCWGDVFRQVKDMPGGEQVVLKVRRE